MDNLFLQMDIISAVDKVLKDNGYDTDAFYWDDNFDFSKMAEQIVAWAEEQKTALEETR